MLWRVTVKLCSDQEMVPVSLEESMLCLGEHAYELMPMSCWERVLCQGRGEFPPQLGHI